MRVFNCLFICVFFFLGLSCSKSADDDISNSCVPILIDDVKFTSDENLGVDLLEYSLDNLCLHVKLGIGGCDADHVVEMVSDGIILESFPPQIVFDFYDNDPQLCEAYFQIEREYDLSSVNNGEIIIIRFRNSEKSFTIFD